MSMALLDLKRKRGVIYWGLAYAFISVYTGRGKYAKEWIWRQIRGSVRRPYVVFKGRRYDVGIKDGGKDEFGRGILEKYIQVPREVLSRLPG